MLCHVCVHVLALRRESNAAICPLKSDVRWSQLATPDVARVIQHSESAPDWAVWAQEECARF